MPFSSWARQLASANTFVLGLASTAVAGCLWLAIVSYPSTHASNTAEDALATRLNNPRAYVPNCSEPEDKDDADICIQREISEATKGLSFIAYLQLLATVAGTAAVVVSLHFTRQALRAAQDANATARQIGQAQVKAYLTICEPAMAVHELKPILRLKLRNTGNSPALGIVVTGQMEFYSAKPSGLPAPAKLGRMIGALAPGEMSKDVYLEFEKSLAEHPSQAASKMMVSMGVQIEWIDAFMQRTDAQGAFAIEITNPLSEDRSVVIHPTGYFQNDAVPFLPPRA